MVLSFREKENFNTENLIPCTKKTIVDKICKKDMNELKNICRSHFPCPFQKPNHIKCEVTSKEKKKHVFPSVVCDQDLGFGETKLETNIICPGSHPYFDLDYLTCRRSCPKGTKFKKNKYKAEGNQYKKSYEKQGRCVPREGFINLKANSNNGPNNKNNIIQNANNFKSFVKALIFGTILISLKNNKKTNKAIMNSFPGYFEILIVLILYTFTDSLLEPLLNYILNLII